MRTGNPPARHRAGSRWLSLAAAVRRRAAAGEPCGLCGEPIDLTLPPRTPGSFSVDHIVPVSVDPARSLDPANLRPAHYGHNSARGNGQPRQYVLPLNTSRRW